MTSCQPVITTTSHFTIKVWQSLSMKDRTFSREGPAPDPGGPLTLPLLPHPLLPPRSPLMGLAPQPGTLPCLVQAAQEELHACPQGYSCQLSPQFLLMYSSPGLPVLGQEAITPLLVGHPTGRNSLNEVTPIT